MGKFERLLNKAFDELHITPMNQYSLRRHLDTLKKKDVETYRHSVRLSKLGIKVANYLNIDPKPLFFAGALHDLGKVMIDEELLKKRKEFTEEDMEVMKSHPLYSYELLKDVHPYTAAIVVRHHLYQENSYPKDIPEAKFSEEVMRKIDIYSEILAVIDCYDASRTRINEKFLEKKRLTPEEVKTYLLKTHSGQTELIHKLYDAKIFSLKENMISPVYNGLKRWWQNTN